MADDPNIPAWAPGTPAPWLAAYEPLPSSPASPEQLTAPEYAPIVAPAPPPPSMPQPPQRAGETPTPPQEEIAASSPPAAAAAAVPPPVDASIAGAPSGPPAPPPNAGAPPSFMPAWLANMPPQGQAAPTPNGQPIANGGPAQQAAPESLDAVLARTAVDANASPAMRQNAWQALTPDQRTNLVNTADPEKLARIASAAMTPEELATINLNLEKMRIHEQSRQQLALMQKADEDARNNFQAYQASVQQANDATASLAADAQRLSQEKTDPNEHGVGNFVASVLTSAIGGAMSQYTGGRDLALEQLDKRTEQRIAAQKADIANQWQGLGFKRNLIAENLQRSGDMYRAQETYRISQYDRALSELQTRQQDYAQDGTTGLRIASTVQQLQANRQNALLAYNTNFQKFKHEQLQNELDRNKDAREQALNQSTIAKNSADIAKTSAETSKINTENQAAAGDLMVHQPQDYAQMGLPTPPAPMNRADYMRWTAMLKSGSDAAKTATEADATRNAGLIYNPVTRQPLPDPRDPSKLIVLPPAQAETIKDETIATQNAIDSMAAARRALQADPATIDRKKWAKIQNDINQSLPQLAKVYGEKYSARTEEALKDVLNLDYDEYRKRITDKGIGTTTLDNTIDTLVRNGNTTIGGKIGYDATKNPLFLDTSRPNPAPPTKAQKLITKLGDISAKPDIVGQFQSAALPGETVSTAQTREQTHILQQLGAMAMGDGKDKADAIAALQAIAEGKNPGSTDLVRSQARSIIAGALSTELPADMPPVTAAQEAENASEAEP